ncbi:fimbrial protein [Serratia rubidaea]|jgi:type 1 fimbria pilin|uniref:fimbrial protein n=1 Tax=Serratia rubidaea TaxID=61652 RepID=UPI001BAF55CA|nr:fimbrial protein [Serratia rubidaea]MBS0971936.1 fimbrial protein [Serratia rubidaea]MBS6089519.1 fimbrial protein [Serratia marcescens]HBH7557856.1 fimbrial protein [Serratia marcescens]HEJ0022552.1 fimbrial protein [Serratia marcescens]
MKGCSGIALLWIFGALSTPGRAAENMKFLGTLVEPPACTINNGGNIDVDFGNRVGVKKVDGVNYLQPMNYQITCDPNANANAWRMTLEIAGKAATYDKAGVVTNVTDLAIQIRQNGVPFELNKPIAINLTNPPQLEAVPVKRAGSTLKEGAFEATATLKAVYQ